mgnify:CR=1 FL=1
MKSKYALAVTACAGIIYGFTRYLRDSTSRRNISCVELLSKGPYSLIDGFSDACLYSIGACSIFFSLPPPLNYVVAPLLGISSAITLYDIKKNSENEN